MPSGRKTLFPTRGEPDEVHHDNVDNLAGQSTNGAAALFVQKGGLYGEVK
jgi:hypothetical protein